MGSKSDAGACADGRHVHDTRSRITLCLRIFRPFAFRALRQLPSAAVACVPAAPAAAALVWRSPARARAHVPWAWQPCPWPTSRGPRAERSGAPLTLIEGGAYTVKRKAYKRYKSTLKASFRKRPQPTAGACTRRLATSCCGCAPSPVTTANNNSNGSFFRNEHTTPRLAILGSLRHVSQFAIWPRLTLSVSRRCRVCSRVGVCTR